MLNHASQSITPSTQSVPGKMLNFFKHFCLVLFTGAYFVPIYIVFLNTFKPEELILTNPLGLPLSQLTLDNLIRNFSSPTFNVITAYASTALVTIPTLIFVIAITAPLAYVISRNRHGFYRVAYLLLLAGLMVPLQVILLPLIQILKVLGLIFTFVGLILVFIAWYMPFTAFIMSGYIGTIPKQLDEAAMLDGAGPWTIFSRIIFPLMKPIVASVTIFITLWTWNDFITPYTILGSGKLYTITTGIYRAVGQYTQKWDDVFAILFYASVPMIIFFIFFQRHVISGLTVGALKS